MRRRAAPIAALLALALAPAIAAAQTAPAPTPPVPPGLVPLFPPGAGGPPVSGTPRPYYAPPQSAYVPPPGSLITSFAPPAPPPPELDPSVMALLPTTLPFEEGQTLPRGYRLESRPDPSLVVSGALSFGLTYLASVITGAVTLSSGSGNAPLFVPVVGPYVTIGTAQASGAGAVWLILDGLAQTGGATIFVYSLITRERYLERKDRPQLHALVHPELFVGPGVGSLRWTF